MRRELARRRFRGRDIAVVSDQARRALGDDAVILGTRVLREKGETVVEAIAAAGMDVERFQRRMTPAAWSVERGASSEALRSAPRSTLHARRPFVIALVGPTGAGKTTTAIKLAVHAEGFGGKRVGFVTLDTYRAGAVAQLETYADVAGIPLEVVYDAGDVAGALARLAHCDVIVVDTPGRGPKATRADQADGRVDWRTLLAALAPDETHLVVPSTMRTDVAEAVRDGFDATVTHLLPTKLDELPEEGDVADLAVQLDLPVRWVGDGQDIPVDLAAGVPRLLRALGAFGDEPSAPNVGAARRAS